MRNATITLWRMLMTVRRSSGWNSLAAKLEQLVRNSKRRSPSTKRKARRRLFERLENRELMALDILSVSPLDGATNVPLNTDLVFTFNEPVIKGQGNIYVVRQATGTTGITVDVRSPNVSIAGAQVTIDLPLDLALDNTYFVHIDSGAFIDSSSASTAAGTLLEQNFDFLALGPQVFETVGNGADWTPTPPLGFVVDNSSMPTGGAEEWKGWTFARKDFWIAADNQSRDQFTLGLKTVAVADTDEFDDGPAAGRPFNGKLLTKPVDLTGVVANSIKFEFDSSFRPEDSQIGTLEVSYDGGSNWTKLLELNPSNTDNGAPFAKKNLNERLVTGGVTGGGAAIGAVANPSSGSLVFRYQVIGGNDWWWAIDNLKITGDYVGVPYAGLKDPLVWEFTTPESPKLTLTIDKTAMSENGGTAVGTVSRNNLPVGDVVVTLTSNDTSEATVPATVTIPDGQSSVTFPIVAVDDLLSDRTQVVTISATSEIYAASSRSISVLDDEGPKIVSLTPPDNATGVDYKSNFTLTFDTDVKKGSGRIYFVDSLTNASVAEMNVELTNVLVSGATVTIDPPINLRGLTNYYILIDDGAFLDTSSTMTTNAVLQTQTFDLLPLRAFTTEPNGDGTDFTNVPPLGYEVDNSLMPGGSVSDFNGWVFMDKSSWIATEGDQSRSRFTKGTGTVAVADSDAWDDTPHTAGRMNTFLETAAIDLAGITPGSVVLEFDSSFYPELPQYGEAQVSYDDGGTWLPLLFFGDANNTNDGRNDRIVVSSTSTAGSFIGGATVDAALDSPASGLMKFRFSYLEGENNWWWAVDNIVIRGERQGVPFGGISDPTQWNFVTAEAPNLTVTIDTVAMSENGGTATGTVTRNLSSVGALEVALLSSDTSEATVPATVTIPDGQFSVTFPITAVDDTLPDGTQSVIISADAVDYFNVPASINVLDDDFPKIISVSPADNSTGVAVGTNIVVTFDQPIRKGNGFVYLVRSSDNKVGLSASVLSSEVTVAGSTLTVNADIDLESLRDYYLRIDRGAVISVLATPSTGTTLLTQDFELLPLGPAVLEQTGLTPDGRDFTDKAPKGWAVDNTNMPRGGAPEWSGWTFAAKSFWQTQGGQSRANFARGSGTIAVGDTDEWQDYSRVSDQFNSFLTTESIDLDSVQPNTVRIEFDSSFRPEGTTPNPNNQIGLLDVSYDGGTSWSNLLTLDVNNTSGAAAATNVNERRSLTVPNPDTGSMKFRFGLTGTNDWWWAIDNLVVVGDTIGLPFPGLTDATFANFTTAEAKTLSVSAPGAGVENGGIVTGSVSRNLDTAGDVVVTLTSSDPMVGTVPATVTIPAGQASVTFDIALIDDVVFDASKPLVIRAVAEGFVGGQSTTIVSDNEVGEVIITEIMYDPAGEEQRTEWVELVNRGTSTVDLGGWRLDDEDKQDWGAIPAGTLLEPGQIAVVYNSFFGLNTDALVRTQWSVPLSAKVVGVLWSAEDDLSNKGRGGLFNNPSVTEEILVVRDASGVALNTVNFAEDGVIWPAYANGASIYLALVELDNTIGTNWRSARQGVDGGVNGIGPNYSTTDAGSPGWILPNAKPTLTVANASVSGVEGTSLNNNGTWSDANASDTVVLTASAGTVTRNPDGTWSWTIAGPDNVAPTNVTITANDGNRGVTVVSFSYGFTNVAPGLTAAQSVVVGNVLTTLTNSGTWSDVAADTVTLTASKGTVVKNADGTWNWSLPAVAAINGEVVTITATDEDGGTSNVVFTMDALIAVVNSKVYHKGSSFAGTSVDEALDTGKSLAKASAAAQVLSYANVINTTRGVNGLVFDVAGLAATSLTASDFTFRVSPEGAFNEAANPPSSWSSAELPTDIRVIAGSETAPARVIVEWRDTAIMNRWLQIKLLANSTTGLREPQVYYIGHLLGETTGTLSTGVYVVQVADLTPIRSAVGTTALVSSAIDLNKNGLIQVNDITAMRARVGVGQLRNITIPPAGSGSEGEGSVLPNAMMLLSPDSMLAVTERPRTIEPRLTNRIYDVQPLDSIGPMPVYGTQVTSTSTTIRPEVESTSTGASLAAVDLESVDEFFADLSKKRSNRFTREAIR
jgi:hypothetical protein